MGSRRESFKMENIRLKCFSSFYVYIFTQEERKKERKKRTGTSTHTRSALSDTFNIFILSQMMCKPILNVN